MSKVREIGKSVLFGGLKNFGVYKKNREKNRDKAIVLTYHGLIPHIPPGQQRYEYRNFVTSAQFDEHLGFLKEHYRPLSVEDFYPGSDADLAGGFLITFDDGFRNNLRYAVPILRKHGLKACFFITTGKIGTKELLWTEKVTLYVLRTREKRITLEFDQSRSFDLATIPQREESSRQIRSYLKTVSPEKVAEVVEQMEAQIKDVPTSVDHELADRYIMMTWEEVNKMIEAGHTIGSHTHTHPMLSTLTADQSMHELKTSRDLIEEHTGQKCQAMSYPNGQKENYSDTTLQQLEELGYQCAFTQQPLFNDRQTARFELKRFNVTQTLPLSLFEAKLSGYQV